MKKIIIILIGIILITSCEDMLDTTPEVNVNIANFWQNEHEVEAFVNSMHLAFNSANTNIPWVFGETRAQSTDGMTNWLWTHIYANDLAYEYLSFDWSAHFTTIAHANTILDNLHRADMPQERMDYYEGMARFIRAYSYFTIARNWGEAPLLLSSTDVSVRPKATIAELSEAIINDLELAKDLLPPYSELTWADGSKVNIKQMPSKGAANATLAHVYAWYGSLNDDAAMLQKSIASATAVIESPEYSLAPSINAVCEDVLLGNSSEGIFEIEARASMGDQVPSYAFLATLTTSYPVIPKKLPGDITYWELANVIKAESIMEIFNDTVDDRRSEYFYELDSMATVPESTGRSYLQKWRHVVLTNDGNDDFQTFEDNIILLRLADIILLRAEVNNKLGNEATALIDLETIRQRANAKSYSPQEGSLKLAILKERQKELYLENHRFFDLVRNNEVVNMVESFSNVTEQDILDGAYYWPVGSKNFLKNPHMRQNIYWKRQGL